MLCSWPLFSGGSSACHTYSGARPVFNAIKQIGAMTFTTVAEHLTLELPLPVSIFFGLSRPEFEHQTFRICEAYALNKWAMPYKGKRYRL